MDKKKILIVEDEAEMRMMLALELETSGYEVFQAEDGEVGFHLAQEVKPDLIIADVVMPKVNGNQLLRNLRGTDFGRDIPFIVLTARRKMRDYFELIEVAYFIDKPFEADELLAKVELALKGEKSKDQPASTNEVQSKEKSETPKEKESQLSCEEESTSSQEEVEVVEGSTAESPTILSDNLVNKNQFKKEDRVLSRWIYFLYGAALLIFSIIFIVNLMKDK